MLFDRHAREIAHSLPHAAQRIEQRRFARVGIAQQSDGDRFVVFGGSHGPSRSTQTSPPGRTRTPSVSLCRKHSLLPAVRMMQGLPAWTISTRVP